MDQVLISCQNISNKLKSKKCKITRQCLKGFDKTQLKSLVNLFLGKANYKRGKSNIKSSKLVQNFKAN